MVVFVLMFSWLSCHISAVRGFSVQPSSKAITTTTNIFGSSPSFRFIAAANNKQRQKTSSLIIFSTPDNENSINSNNKCDQKCNDENLPTTATETSSSSSSSSSSSPEEWPVSPLMLKPFLPAADPRYVLEGSVGEDDFVLQRHGGPRAEELTNENLLRIVQLQCSDLEVNTLIWKCLGYRFVTETNDEDGSVTSYWSNDEVFPKWRERYPQPPDLIGMQRIYSKEVDQPSLRSNQALIRSIPLENKQSLKTHLKPLGFNGYKYSELTPNKTRRAQCTNWLLYYRENLFGYTVEELKERRRLQDETELQQRQAESKEVEEEKEWKPPIQQVF